MREAENHRMITITKLLARLTCVVGEGEPEDVLYIYFNRTAVMRFVGLKIERYTYKQRNIGIRRRCRQIQSFGPALTFNQIMVDISLIGNQPPHLFSFNAFFFIRNTFIPS